MKTDKNKIKLYADGPNLGEINKDFGIHIDGYTFNPHAKIRFYMEQRSTNYKSIGNVDLSSPV